ncbi:MAG: MFS transporter [Nitrospira sp.]|nr:MFS transporter [Nitrospira sp.]MDH4304129.1 MFS transporter [Nitrospira sp.]MDH5192608.1 MFS transporter [Nitrospira sp.]
MQGSSGPVADAPAVLEHAQHSSVDTRPLLLTWDFGLVWWGQLISQIGDGVCRLALLWFVYAVTGSPLKTSIIGLLQTIPPIILGPIIGVYVDRLPKKVLLITSDILRALLIGLIPCLIPVESFTVSVLYVLVFLHAVSTAVFGPALTAAVPTFVPKTQFTAANALLQGTTSLGIVFGPAISGIGIAAYGSQEVLCINAATYLISAACLALVRFKHTAVTSSSAGPRSTLVQDLIEGFRYGVVTKPALLLLTGTAALYTFGTSALTALFPVFARKMLGLGPVEVGYLWSALGMGLLVTSIALLWVTDWMVKDRMRLIMASSVLSGLALSGLTWTLDPYVAGILMGLIGCGMGAFTPIAWGIIQEMAPSHMIGRVLGLYGTGAMTAAIGGISAFGWITEQQGPETGILGIGLVLMITALVATRMSRASIEYEGNRS